MEDEPSTYTSRRGLNPIYEPNSSELSRRASRRGRAKSAPKTKDDGAEFIGNDSFEENGFSCTSFIRSRQGRPVAPAPADPFKSHRKRTISFGAVLPTKPYSSEIVRCYKDDRDFQPSTLDQLKTSASSWFDVPYRTKQSGISRRCSWKRTSSTTRSTKIVDISRE